MEIKLRTSDMPTCAELTAMAVLMAAEVPGARMIKREGEVVTYGVIDRFTIKLEDRRGAQRATIRTFTDPDMVRIETDLDIKPIAVEEIFWRVTRKTPEAVA